MSLTKKVRFEVFKRDKFTCQYCGRQAPDVVLQADHIDPVANGGSDDILNLITSCYDCNQGKKHRLLSDDAAIQKRKQQLDELQERREQLEMLMEWHRGLLDLEEHVITEIADFWSELTPGYGLGDSALVNLKRWVKKFGASEVIEAMKASTSQYLEYTLEPHTDADGNSRVTRKLTVNSIDKAFTYIPKICTNRRKIEEKPYLKRLYYIRGILRNRIRGYFVDWEALQLLEKAVKAGAELDDLEEMAKEVKNWTGFKEAISNWTNSQVN